MTEPTQPPAPSATDDPAGIPLDDRADLALAGRAGWFRRLGPSGLMTIATLVVPPLGAVLLLAQARHWAEPLRQSPWGPPIAAAAFTVVGGFALLPTAALSLFAGWAFGFALGTGVAAAGFAGASWLCYTLARRAAGQGVVDTVEANPRWRAIHRALLGGGAVRTFLIIALLRLPTVPPFAATSVALASLNVRFWPYLLGTVAGILPRTAAYAFLASKFNRPDVEDNAEYMQMLVVWMAVTLVVIGVVTLLARRALKKLTAEA